MNTPSNAHPAHFLMAIVAAFSISFSLASVAAVTGLLPEAKVVMRPSGVRTPWAGKLHAAAAHVAAKSAADRDTPSPPAPPFAADFDKLR